MWQNLKIDQNTLWPPFTLTGSYIAVLPAELHGAWASFRVTDCCWNNELQLLSRVVWWCYQPLAFCRPSWKNRGPNYTEFGVQMRCVKRDQTSSVGHLFVLLILIIMMLRPC